MNEIIKINLDNEMDLILVHKRTMKIGELCGLNTASQTTFATAVSEIARCAIGCGENSSLTLGIDDSELRNPQILAKLCDSIDLSTKNSEAFSYAKRLMGQLISTKMPHGHYEIVLKQRVNFPGLMTKNKISSIVQYFKNEPPISPYDEIRKKNIQLIDLANKLQESENQYKVLTDTLPLLIFSIGSKGEVNYSNKGLNNYLGDNHDQITSLSWQKFVHPDDYNQIWKAWDESQIKEETFRAEARLLDRNNNYLWHLVSIVPVKDSKNEIINWIGFFVNIHSQKVVEETLKDNIELKQVRDELKKKQAELEKKIEELNVSNYNLEQYAFIASHDLQEPLRKIVTFSNLIEKDVQLNEQQQHYFDRIKASAGRMSTLIKDMLNYARLSAADEKLEESDLRQIMENVLLDLEVMLEKKAAVVKVISLPVARVYPSQISQLFSNLISNSIKYSKRPPEILIETKELSEEEKKSIRGLKAGKDYYHISFKDNGIGFSNEFSDKIFIIFHKLKDSDAPGTGIGLAICRRIMDNHQGLINASAKVNEGAVFNIYLPIN